MIDRIQQHDEAYVVSPNSLQRSLIARGLVDSGLGVSCHASAEEMAKAYDPHRGGCVVVEYQRASGFAVVDALARAGIGIPVVYFAKNAAAADGVAAMKSGAVDFLELPVTDLQLIAAVRKGVRQDENLRRKQTEQADFQRRLQRLTARELETMDLIVAGKSVKSIASTFNIGNQTASKHRSRLLAKMHVNCDVELVLLLHACGIPLPDLSAAEADS